MNIHQKQHIVLGSVFGCILIAGSILFALYAAKYTYLTSASRTSGVITSLSNLTKVQFSYYVADRIYTNHCFLPARNIAGLSSGATVDVYYYSSEPGFSTLRGSKDACDFWFIALFMGFAAGLMLLLAAWGAYRSKSPAAVLWGWRTTCIYCTFCGVVLILNVYLAVRKHQSYARILRASRSQCTVDATVIGSGWDMKSLQYTYAWKTSHYTNEMVVGDSIYSSTHIGHKIKIHIDPICPNTSFIVGNDLSLRYLRGKAMLNTIYGVTAAGVGVVFFIVFMALKQT